VDVALATSFAEVDSYAGKVVRTMLIRRPPGIRIVRGPQNAYGFTLWPVLIRAPAFVLQQNAAPSGARRARTVLG